MSSSEWSITDWQCGMGVVDSCKNQKINWDEPRSWQALVDQIIPLAETGIVFGFQYISSSIGDGATKAMNSLRCMLNSGVSSLWALGAGSWLLLKYAGLEGDLRPTLDDGYLYVCTCIYDVNGIKEMLGQSAESNSQFSYCSEAGYNERIKAREEKDKLELAQKEAAAEALVQAAQTKKKQDTIDAMKGLDGCALRSSSALDDAKCQAAATTYFRQSAAITRFWKSSVDLSGGAEDTKNKVEQTNLAEAAWILEGTIAGLQQLYPERFDDQGNLVQKCVDTSGTTQWGEDNCSQIIADWKSTQDTAGLKLCQGTDACNAAISCTAGNDPAGAPYTTTDNCDLVPLEYGYSHWQDKTTIVCTDPATLSELSGIAQCKNNDGTWVSRSSYTNPDQPIFRSVGEDVGKNVKDEDIKCLAADFMTVRTTSANCYPYWIEGGTIEVGVDLSGKPIKQDKFIWLTQEGITCGNDPQGVEQTGYAKCKIGNEIPCNTSKLARLNINAQSESICIPTITWKSRE